MNFKIPGMKTHVRIFEPVETTDSQYQIADIGLQYGNGDIDSIAVGGSFATVRNWAAEKDAEADKAEAEAKAKTEATAEPAAA